MPGNSSMPSNSSDPSGPAPLEVAKRPPTDYEPHEVGPSKTTRAGFWDGNWITFTFLLPYVIMRAAHEPLGISNALLMGDRNDALYNLCMLLALALGNLAFLVHTFALPLVKGQGWGWVAPKLLFLGAFWGAILFATIYSMGER
jgi:hypothetical protein